MRSYLIILLVVAVNVRIAAAEKPALRGNEAPQGNGPPNGLLEQATTHSQALKTVDTGAIPPIEEEIDPKDTGHRFAKFEMYDNKQKPNMQYTGAYPLPEDISTLLRYHSNAYSVVTPQDYRMKHHDVTHYIDKAGGYPARPSTDLYSEYWEQFRFVCQVQLDRRQGRLPSDAKIWTPPDLWANETAPEMVAEKVHDEFPGDNQAALLFSWFMNGRTSIQLDHDILPFRCREDFIGTEVRLAALNTWAITSTFIC